MFGFELYQWNSGERKEVKDGFWRLDSWELPQPIRLIGVVIFGDDKGWRVIVLQRACSVRNMVLSEPLVQGMESLLGDGKRQSTDSSWI